MKAGLDDYDLHLSEPVPDPVPLRGPTRMMVEWDGPCYAYTDARTGYTLEIGCVANDNDEDAEDPAIHRIVGYRVR